MSPATPQPLTMNTLSDLELHCVAGDMVTYRGKRAVRLAGRGDAEGSGSPLAVFPGSHFRDGVIEAELAGVPHADALSFSRGFVGLAFRVQPGGTRYDCFFLRPANGRADDQLRRNHSTQYISMPDHPWHRLRDDHPGVYESYVDLDPGVWTSVRIVVTGTRAQLHVHGAEQPCLIVNDLKQGETAGQIALWVGSGTDAYFANVTVSK
jgi:hypothetical protein